MISSRFYYEHIINKTSFYYKYIKQIPITKHIMYTILEDLY